MMLDFYDEIVKAREERKNLAVCTVVETRGSTPRKTGSRMLVFQNGCIHGTIGGGNLEKVVIQNALNVLEANLPKLFKHDLLNYHQMCCGGSMDIYIEPVMKYQRLYIFGAGHTGQALAQLSNNLGFEIVMIDDRKEYLDQIINKSIEKINLPFEKILTALPFDENTFICIMTYSHPMDREILAHCIKQPHAYLGMIGSQRKVEITRKLFKEGGIATEEEMQQVDMPMGINIGAEGPEEIAISILAKIISIKNHVRYG